MILISNCIELNSKATSNIANDMGYQYETTVKNAILDYLENGADAGVRCSVVVDRVTGDQLPQTIHRYTDDEYIWTDEDIYHFNKYNIKLKEDFLRKVLKAS